ncbi:MAG: Gfo/Idh/MocA family oxidoreductase [Opitutaceae bacterium]
MSETMRVGIIGLDTSHVGAFTRFLNDPSTDGHQEGAKVTVAWPAGSPDMPASRDRIEGFTAELRDKFGVAIVDSPEAVVAASDAILLCSVDGRVHHAQFARIAAAGKPVFIDKPFAASVKDAEAMAALARQHGTRVFTSSALRFSTALTDALAGEADDPVTGADFCGPMAIDPTNPGFFWYGVHTIEMLFRCLGKGCRSVLADSSEAHDCLIGRWDDGRFGVIRGNRTGDNGFHGMVHFRDRTVHINVASAQRSYFAGLLEAVVAFFKGGEAPVPLETSVEIVRFMEAGNRSRLSRQVESLY